MVEFGKIISVYNAYNNGAGFNRIFTVQLYLYCIYTVFILSGGCNFNIYVKIKQCSSVTKILK